MRNQSSIGSKNTLILSALRNIVEAHNTFGLDSETKQIIWETAVKLENKLQHGGLPIVLRFRQHKLEIDETTYFSDLEDNSLNSWKELEQWAKSKIGTPYAARGRRIPLIFETYALSMNGKGAYFTFKEEMHGIYIEYKKDVEKNARK